MDKIKEEEVYCLLLPDKDFDIFTNDKEDLARMLSIRP